jgi:hypothetical protein
MMCFSFQNTNEVHGIKVSFTIKIPTPSQLQSMISLCDNGVVSIDVTFGTNDVKFHLFTLKVFDAHHIKNVGCMDHYKLSNMQQFGGMIKYFENKASKEDV